MDHSVQPGVTPPAPGLDKEEPSPLWPEKDIPDEGEHGTSHESEPVEPPPHRPDRPGGGGDEERGSRDVERE